MLSRNNKNATVQRGVSTTPCQSQPEQLLLRGGEVAALLGVSRALAFRWMQDGVLPTVRIPGARTVRVPTDALREWIDRNTGTGLMRSPPVAAGRVSSATSRPRLSRKGGTPNAR
jgi:excisionase family DNA binding protein